MQKPTWVPNASRNIVMRSVTSLLYFGSENGGHTAITATLSRSGQQETKKKMDNGERETRSRKQNHTNTKADTNGKNTKLSCCTRGTKRRERKFQTKNGKEMLPLSYLVDSKLW